MLCDRPESFKISAGSVTIRGPGSHQDRTCVSGQTCAFGDIYGLYIHPDDRFMILDTCGSPFLPPGVTSLGMIQENDTLEEGMSFTETNATKSDTVVRVAWTPDTFSGPGGIYRLCWCAAGFECDREERREFPHRCGNNVFAGSQCKFPTNMIDGFEVSAASSSELAFTQTSANGNASVWRGMLALQS